MQAPIKPTFARSSAMPLLSFETRALPNLPFFYFYPARTSVHAILASWPPSVAG